MTPQKSEYTKQVLSWITKNPEASSDEFLQCFDKKDLWRYYQGRRALIQQGVIKKAQGRKKKKFIGGEQKNIVPGNSIISVASPQIGDAISLKNSQSKTLAALERDVETTRYSLAEAMELFKAAKKRFWDAAYSMVPSAGDFQIAVDKPFKEILLVADRRTAEEID